MRDFRSYSEAKRAGDKLVSDLAKGSFVADMTPAQARDARAALERLQGFYEQTGRRVSLLGAVSEYAEAAGKLNGGSLAGAVENYLATVATVKRVDLLQAVEEFIEGRRPKTVAKEGKRPQLSPGYHYTVSLWLREFAKTVGNYAVCDLRKELLDTYMARHGDVSPKTRNERRGVVRMFLAWCAKKDYLPASHRLLEADGMTHEVAEPEDIDLYTAPELQAMLDRASRQPKPAMKGKEPEADYRHLLPLIALVGLGGVRLQEAARMTFADVWHVEGHIEVRAGRSKTRARRLSTMPASLAQWLEPYRECSGPVWTHCLDHFHRAFESMMGELKITVRRNALRHSFISAHYAVHSDEGLTAKEAGNSPGIVHKNYKGLLTKADGGTWFAVAPVKPANVIELSTRKAVTT
jgi:integrase